MDIESITCRTVGTSYGIIAGHHAGSILHQPRTGREVTRLVFSYVAWERKREGSRHDELSLTQSMEVKLDLNL